MSGKADPTYSDTYNVASTSHGGVVHSTEYLTGTCCGRPLALTGLVSTTMI